MTSMTAVVTTGAGQPPAGPDRRRSPVGLLGVVLAAVVLFAAGWAGASSLASPRWQSGEAHVGWSVFSIVTDDWTYGGGTEVPLWYDARGRRHEAGRPDCFGPRRTVTTVPVRFIAREVTIEGVTSRVVVAVDCG